MNKIEELYKAWTAAQPIKSEIQRRMDEQFMIDFNYNSNHLEGNTLTYGQTKLLLIFGETTGTALLKDYEEMKAHNVGLEMTKIEALDKERTLSESFIRDLNKTILVRDYYKTSRDGSFRYQIKVGVYKTRPNSVITATGEMFDYASPEETPALMSDLVRWYNEEEQRGRLSPIELAALFHYRYIRIHPFEDGNGRIARLLVNYILLKHGYPMVVVRTDDRKNYLEILHQCDLRVGRLPSDGANAPISKIVPFVDYFKDIVAQKITKNLDFIQKQLSGTIKYYWWYNNAVITIKNENQQQIIELLLMNATISVRVISDKLGINKSAVQKHLDSLKGKGYITREGGTRGKWKVNLREKEN
jgi:Fic family protein